MASCGKSRQVREDSEKEAKQRLVGSNGQQRLAVQDDSFSFNIPKSCSWTCCSSSMSRICVCGTSPCEISCLAILQWSLICCSAFPFQVFIHIVLPWPKTPLCSDVFPLAFYAALHSGEQGWYQASWDTVKHSEAREANQPTQKRPQRTNSVCPREGEVTSGCLISGVPSAGWRSEGGERGRNRRSQP